MKPPLYVGPLSNTQHQQLEPGLHSGEGFKLRRGQSLLASARGERRAQSAVHVGCTAPPVRNILRAYRADPTTCWHARSPRPKHAIPRLDQANGERLRARLHESPRVFGKNSSLWTLARLAEVCAAQGLTRGTVSVELSRRAWQRMGVNWKRAKPWITSPDPR